MALIHKFHIHVKTNLYLYTLFIPTFLIHIKEHSLNYLGKRHATHLSTIAIMNKKFTERFPFLFKTNFHFYLI